MRLFLSLPLIALALVFSSCTSGSESETSDESNASIVGANKARGTDRLSADMQSFLESADSIELLKLDGGDAAMESEEPSDLEDFHGGSVLLTVELNEAERVKVINDLYRTVALGDGQAKCFFPRHGIRAKMDGQVLELALCYECGWGIAAGKYPQSVVLVGGTPSAMDAILTAHAPKSEAKSEAKSEE